MSEIDQNDVRPVFGVREPTLWSICIAFSLAAYLFFAKGMPYLIASVSRAALSADNAEKVVGSTAAALAGPFHIVGIVAMVVVLLQPLKFSLRKRFR